MQAIEKLIVKAIRQIKDPEIPVNIYDLGLIYSLEVSDAGAVQVRMTLTSPGCPVAGMILQQVETKVREVEGVTEATVELVWDPPWTQDRMTDAARLELNLEPGQSIKPAGPKFFNISRPG